MPSVIVSVRLVNLLGDMIDKIEPTIANMKDILIKI